MRKSAYVEIDELRVGEDKSEREQRRRGDQERCRAAEGSELIK